MYALWKKLVNVTLTGLTHVPKGMTLDLQSGSTLNIGGVALTATAAELNKNHSVTAGTVAASSVVVADANKDVAGFRNVTAAGSILANGAASGIGYATGAGGTVAQGTSKSTGVTLNSPAGQITMQAAALLNAAKVSFVVTCSACGALDVPNVAVLSGGTANAYRASVTAVAAGSFTITVENITGGSLSEAPVIGYVILKGVAS